MIAALLGGCATLPPECKTEYAHTIAHCPKRSRAPANAEECNSIGGVAIIEDRRYKGCASPDQVRDLLRGRYQ